MARADRAGAWQRRLDQPLSGSYCILSWLLATAIFVGLVALLGGPTDNDASESFYSTWALQHGEIACTYPPHTAITQQFFPDYQAGPQVAPLWVLISGGAAAVVGIGHSVPFPSAQALGVGCSRAYLEMYRWAGAARPLLPTLGLGYLAWFGLLAGVVALLRASGRGRSGWEALGVILVACLPVVWMPLLDQYHPQDILAMGLVLLGIACLLRRYWALSGVLLAGAVLSQQFGLLVLAPAILLIPTTRAKVRFAGSAIGAGFAVVLPFIVWTSGKAWSAVILGTGDFASRGGTVLAATGLHGHPMLFVSRFFPILASIALAWWIARRLGEVALEPVPLIAFLALTLSLRLIFEIGLYGYKFLALALMLVLLDLASGRMRELTFVWLGLLTLVFNPVPSGLAFNARPFGNELHGDLPVVVIAIGVGILGIEAVHRRIHWWLLGGVLVAAAAFLNWPLDVSRAQWPLWSWQIILVSSGVGLAITPLWRMVRRADMTHDPTTSVGLSSAPQLAHLPSGAVS